MFTIISNLLVLNNIILLVWVALNLLSSASSQNHDDLCGPPQFPPCDALQWLDCGPLSTCVCHGDSYFDQIQRKCFLPESAVCEPGSPPPCTPNSGCGGDQMKTCQCFADYFPNDD